MALKFDVDTTNYDFYEHNPLSSNASSIAVSFLLETTPYASLNTLKNTTFYSLTLYGGMSGDLELGAHRALQLLAKFGSDQLVKHMFGIDTTRIKALPLSNVLSIPALKEKAAEHHNLYLAAKNTLSQLGYFNKYQVPLYDSDPGNCLGLESLIKLLRLVLISSDIN